MDIRPDAIRMGMGFDEFAKMIFPRSVYRQDILKIIFLSLKYKESVTARDILRKCHGINESTFHTVSSYLRKRGILEYTTSNYTYKYNTSFAASLKRLNTFLKNWINMQNEDEKNLLDALYKEYKLPQSKKDRVRNPKYKKNLKVKRSRR